MPGLLDFMQDPRIALAAGLLSPQRNSAFGPALGQGLQNMNAQAQVNQQSLAAKQALAQAESAAQQRKKFSGLLGTLPTNATSSDIAGLFSQAGSANNLNSLVNAAESLAPKASRAPTLPEIRLLAAQGDPTAKAVLQGIVDEKIAGGSQNIQTVGGELPYKIPVGFMLADPNDPSQGVTPIPGSDKDAEGAGDAAKISQMRVAQSSMDDVFSRVYEDYGTDGFSIETGNPNRTNILNATTMTPFSEGRELGTAIQFGIQAITRAETGAAMPPSEVRNTRKRFQPSSLDSDESIAIKMSMYEEFIDGTLKLIDPSGRFDEARFQQEFNARKKQSGGKSTGNKTFSYDAQGNLIEK